jgi:1-phosphofructokinase family hexose kinase
VILTVTPNPALDVTYTVDRLVPHASHRVTAVREMAGGKGLNVTSVLAQRGIPVLATGPVGGPAGARLVADLDARGIAHDLVPTSGETRRTVTVVSQADGEATAFNEPGAGLSAQEWSALVASVTALLATHRPRVMVASGSVPRGFPAAGYGRLVEVGHAAGCLVVVDASRDALLGSLAARPDVVKPNRHELAEATGLADPVAGARALQAQGARHVVASLGPDGLLLAQEGGDVLRAALAEPLRGNPTGAGDAAVAAIAAGLAAGSDWEAILCDAVAWSAAAVLQPVAGQVGDDDITRLRAGVRVWRS